MNPVWAKAPLLLLLRYRKIFVAVLGAAVLLGLASVAGPLFLSSSGSAAVADQLTGNPPLATGFRINRFDTFATPEAREGLTERNEVLAATIGAEERIADPVVTLLGPARNVRPVDGRERVRIRLIARTGAIEHVDIIAGDASGALLADTMAEALGGVEPGDSIRPVGASEPLEISGIYAALENQPFDPYWVNFVQFIYPGPIDATPPPLLIVPEDMLFDLAADMELNGNYAWEFPVRTRDLTLPDAKSLAVYMQTLARVVNDNENIGGDAEARLRETFDNGTVNNTFPQLIRSAQETVTALEGPVLVLSYAGRLVALAVIAAAGAYLVVSRRTETLLLVARGMTPLLQGLRSTVEAALPGALGLVAGGATGFLLVRSVGPSDLIAQEDVRGALAQSLVTLVVGLLAVGIAAMVAVRSSGASQERQRRSLTRFPWELPVLLLAGAAYYEITTRTSVIIEGDEGDRIDIFVLLFPILFMIGAAGVVARLLRVAFSKLRSLGDGSSAVYLATHRLAAAPGSIVGLLIASILAVGILVYAQSLAQTITASTEAKAGVFVGSDVSMLVYPNTEIPEDFDHPATFVRRINNLEMTNGVTFTMLGVDRSTFESAAFWDDSFADRPLGELLDQLEPGEGPLPVIVAAGDSIEEAPQIDLSTDIPLSPVARIRAFPGLPAGEPLVIADLEALRETFLEASSSASAASEELIWARGDPQVVLQDAFESGISFGLTQSTDQVLARPTLASVTWAFDLLRALGVAAGVIALLSVLLYMQARQRSTVVAYAMARRMGLGRFQHAISLAIELAALLAVAATAGTLLAIGVARLLFDHIDLLPTIPPDPLLRIPGTVVIAIFGLGVLAAIVGALFVQRGADRARIAEVLRLAE